LKYVRIWGRGVNAVSAVWFYQIQGFELGPVPLTEMSRLILKGRIKPDTLVRQDSGEWVHAEAVTSLYPGPAEVPDAWLMILLERFAAFGIPSGVALLPWGRFASLVGLLILAVFAVALIRLLVELARDLRAIRRKLTAE
jgi:hypothetical protein